jgi:hypothetical protein
VSDDIHVYERGVLGWALKLNSSTYPFYDPYGDLPLQGKIPTAEPGIDPGTACLVVRSSDHQATRLVTNRTINSLKLHKPKTLGFISQVIVVAS